MKTFVHAGLVTMLITSATFAHHGLTEYDTERVIRYEGVVTEVQWKNPHNVIVLESVDPSGRPLVLSVEGGGPSILVPLGVMKDSILPGDHVIAVVSPSRRSSAWVLGREVIKDDGTIIPLGSQAVGSPETSTGTAVASGLSGTWLPSQGAFFQMILNRTSVAFTPAGREAFDTKDPTMSSQAKCIPVSAPWLMVHPIVIQVERRDDRVLFAVDWMGAERTVYLDGRDHPSDNEVFQQGHSVGRWEGNTLVVDTTNFAKSVYAGIATGAQKHLVERFSLTNDGRSLDYSFTWRDPEYLAEPMTGTYRWSYRPDLKPSDVECDLTLASRYVREAR